MRLLKILGSLLAGALIVTLAVAAKAQSRYDSDQQWIRNTIKQERRAEHHERHALQVEYRYRDRWQSNPVRRHYYAPKDNHYHPKDWRYRTDERRADRHEHRKDAHNHTRVYGYIAEMTQQDKRDCHGGCCPPVENISRDHGAETRAWNDAQLGWMKAVAVRYGAMYADVQNVDARTLRRQCFRSTFGETWLDRNREALAQNTGVGDGFKWTCRIIASPCIAPIQNDTPLKGDKPL